MISQAMDRVQFRSLMPGVAELSAPFAIDMPHFDPKHPPPALPKEIADVIRMGQVAHAPFVAVGGGRCAAVVEAEAADGGEPRTSRVIDLATSDLLVLTRDVKHRLCDHPATPSRSLFELLPFPPNRPKVPLRFGGGGEVTSLVFGVFLFHGDLGIRLLRSLPPVIHLRQSVDVTEKWLPDLLRLLSTEAADEGPGWATIVDRLASVLFCNAVRFHVRSLATGGVGEKSPANWLLACMDESIGPAMVALHDRYAEAWTVESLADIVAMSRSAFASSFAERVGTPPLQYLAQVRMQHAAEALVTGEDSIKSIARKVGYTSEAAFSAAFRRERNTTPLEFRRAHQSVHRLMTRPAE